MAYVRVIDQTHGCKTGITITESIRHAPFGTLVMVSSVWDILPGSAEPLLVTTENEVSLTGTLELPVVVYNGLYAHDFAIGNAYKQNGWSPPEEP